MSSLVTDAVKEAFMEVDEEAPGGWQGWRMWNEMVMSDMATASQSFPSTGNLGQDPIAPNWNSHHGSGVYDIDPVQHATEHSSNDVTMDHNQWDFVGYR